MKRVIGRKCIQKRERNRERRVKDIGNKWKIRRERERERERE